MSLTQHESKQARLGSVNENLPYLMSQFPILDAYTHLGFGFELAPGVDRVAVA